MDFNNLSKDIGESVRKIRKMKKYTVIQLAKELNLSEGHLRNIESGNSNPSLPALILIANFFKVPLETFVNGYITYTKPDIDYTINSVFEDCTDSEAHYLIELLDSQKKALRKFTNTIEKKGEP